MKKLIVLLIALGFFIPGYSFAATHDIHIEWTYDYQLVEGRTLAGYNLYQEGVEICTSNTPTDRAIDCTFESDDGTYLFTITAFCTDGFESSHSPPYSFSLSSPSEPELLAAINTTPTSLSGDIPFTVSFDASTSTGDIASYSWDFGDNSNGSGPQTTHTYTTAGTFTATLTVTSLTGTVNQKSVSINVDPAPVAAITTSPTLLSGDAPFTVFFDASNSTGNISSYTWNFGDNNSGSGSQTSHTFTTTGTFDTTLTVTSPNGSTSLKTVTVSVTAAPIAAITTTPLTLTGDIPLTVSFDATASTGDIASYAWDFGDNSTGSGSQVSHTYTTAGTFTALLTVTSSNGSTSQKNITITATTPESSPETFNIYLEWSHDYQPIEGRTLAGYHLYQEGIKICTNNTPANRVMDCSFESQPGTFDFTLTAFCNDGYESPHSSPYNFTLSEAYNPEFAASITTVPTALSGNVPFTVAFDGTSSPGAISYQWMFGDGDLASTSQIEHTYTAAGTFTSTLTVTDSAGHINAKSVTVTVTEAPAENTIPTAVIGSSTAMGDAPLTVLFDGTESHDAEGPINSYLWNFGDGSQATTASTTSHNYTIAGTYNASLTVSDSQGATDTTYTPVIVAVQAPPNQAPIARITVSTTDGTIPLTVNFDGSTSTDPEDSALSYNWNFGDGTNAQGAIVSHMYTSSGSFTVTLTVTDNMGAAASATTTINSETPAAFTIELGEVEIDNNWVRVDITEQFNNPIIVAGPPGTNDSAPCVIRLRNVSTTGFDIRIQEWDYDDGTHSKETVAYLILEQGSFTLDDGTMVEAGQFESNDSEFQNVLLNSTFTSEPVVMTSFATINEATAITGRLRNISTTSFDYMTQEQESSTAGHGNETVNYIAWEPSQNNMDGLNWIVNKTADKVRNRWYTIDYGTQLDVIPIVLGTMQSMDGPETSTIRYANKTNEEIQVMVQEEQSLDDETRHTSETVGYLLFFSN